MRRSRRQVLVGVWWLLAAVSCGRSDEQDLDLYGEGSWEPPEPEPEPEPEPHANKWYHCGEANGTARCLPGRVPEGANGKSHRSSDCDGECSMYKCRAQGSNPIQCSADPRGTYATEPTCRDGCHLYRCDGSECIQDDLHGTYFSKRVRLVASALASLLPQPRHAQRL